jgi:hypothetical protein
MLEEWLPELIVEADSIASHATSSDAVYELWCISFLLILCTNRASEIVTEWDEATSLTNGKSHQLQIGRHKYASIAPSALIALMVIDDSLYLMYVICIFTDCFV